MIKIIYSHIHDIHPNPNLTRMGALDVRGSIPIVNEWFWRPFFNNFCIALLYFKLTLLKFV